MAEPTETVPAVAANTGGRHGTTPLSRVSAMLAWFVGAWFLMFGYGYAPLLVVGALVIWLGIGAWRRRRGRTIGLAALAAVAAAYYPVAGWWSWTHRSEPFAEERYPAAWVAVLALQSTVLLAIAVTAALSLRRPASPTSRPNTT